MFKLEFLPATIGDAIFVTYGTQDEPRYLLVDGGTAGTRKHIEKKLRSVGADAPLLELVVVSHIDKDHIQGIRTLLERRNVDFDIGDFWYNGFHHLPAEAQTGGEAEGDAAGQEDEELGARQGEALSAALLEQHIRWNGAFNGNSVMISDDGPLPMFVLDGGMLVTVLGPTAGGLGQLRLDWIAELTKAGITPGATVPEEPDDGDDERLGVADFLTADDVEELAQVPCPGDSSSANGSSIALLLEFEGKRALLAADAHADHLLGALERLSPDSPLPVDLFKVSHHGSKGTTDRALIEKVETSHYVFSTNGSIFKHPDDETVAKVLTFGNDGPRLTFNYRRPANTVWEEPTLQQDLGYTTVYPDEGTEGVEVSL